MYGRRDSAVLMTAALALLMMTGTWGQPTDDAASTTPEIVASNQSATADDNSIDPSAFSRPFNGSAESLKKVMWKRCASKNYVTCAKLALVHLVDRLERANESYSLVAGVTVSSDQYPNGQTKDGNHDGGRVPAQTTSGRDSSEAFDRLLVDKLGRYFSTLTLNVKLLDDATAQSVRKLGEAAAIQSGRGKKQKYAQSILLAGWVTGAMLLALGMKAIAVLAGKALMTALMSLLLSALASFRGGGGHSEPKSTTYEIVTKPVYSHSHSNAEDTHAAGSQNNPTYRRSIGGGGGGGSGGVVELQHVPAPPSAEEADHVVYRIHASDKTPIYIPIIDRRRRRRR